MTKLLAEIHQYALIFNAQSEILWVRSADGMKRFILPGGTLEEGENEVEGLHREIKEETNLEVEILQPNRTYLARDKEPNQFAVFYIATNSKGQFKLSHEHTEFKWRKWNEMSEDELPHPDFIQMAKDATDMIKKFKH